MKKLLIILGLSLITSSSYACENLSQSSYCVGDKVTNIGSGSMGEIIGIYQNGKVAVKYNYPHNRKTFVITNSTSQLGVTEGCTINDYCVGDKVTNIGSGSMGEIIGIYQNGKVAVKYNYPHNRKTFVIANSTSQLGVTEGCDNRVRALFDKL